MTHASIANWFNEDYTYEERAELRKQYVPRPQSYLDEEENTEECDYCQGTGDCPDCGGDGSFDHICDCKFCDIVDEDCEECSSSGNCYICEGTGIIYLDEI